MFFYKAAFILSITLKSKKTRSILNIGCFEKINVLYH